MIGTMINDLVKDPYRPEFLRFLLVYKDQHEHEYLGTWISERVDMEGILYSATKQASLALIIVTLISQGIGNAIIFSQINNPKNLKDEQNLLEHFDKLEKEHASDNKRLPLSIWAALALSGKYDLLIKAIDENKFNPIDTRDCSGSTVWHYLAFNGHYEQLSRALNENKFNYENTRNNQGDTVWHSLARYGYYEFLIKAIDENKFNPIDTRNNHGDTVWHHLAFSGHYEHLIKAIDENKFNPNDTRNNKGVTVWHSLASGGKYEQIIQSIHERRFDPLITDNNGATIWHSLSLNGHYEHLIKAIDENRFNPNDTRSKSGATVWHYLASDRYYKKLIQAIDEGRFDPLSTRDNSGATVWHSLSSNGHYELLVKAIDEERFDPINTIDNDGDTVWHYLARNGYYEQLIQAIDENRFDSVNTRDKRSTTVWHHLALGGHYAQLINAIDTNKFKQEEVKTDKDYTVWHSLALGGHYEKLINAAYEGRFDPINTKTKNGATVWNIFWRFSEFQKFIPYISSLINKGMFDCNLEAEMLSSQIPCMRRHPKIQFLRSFSKTFSKLASMSIDYVDEVLMKGPSLSYAIVGDKLLKCKENTYAKQMYLYLLIGFFGELYKDNHENKDNKSQSIKKVFALIVENPQKNIKVLELVFYSGLDNVNVVNKRIILDLVKAVDFDGKDGGFWLNKIFDLTNIIKSQDDMFKDNKNLTPLLPVLIKFIKHKDLFDKDYDCEEKLKHFCGNAVITLIEQNLDKTDDEIIELYANTSTTEPVAKMMKFS
jgi:ankyrin repeat protein